jgi:hypothetical protein
VVNTFRSSILIAALAALTLAAVASAGVAKNPPISFTGKYAGQATTKVDGNTVTISATGTGSGTLIGTGSITGNGTGDSSQQPCVPFGGTGTAVGKAGTIVFKANPGASGCGDEGGHTFSVTGRLLVTNATGKLAKTKGTLKLTGTYSRDDGTFSVKVVGALTK